MSDVVLIGYDRQENLGLLSMAASLSRAGFTVALVPFDPSRTVEIAEEVVALDASLVGLSLIFQFSIEDFGSLARELRFRGSTSVLCAGGHFPSLRPQEALSLIPELDVIVRFEGEETIVDLMRRLADRGSWPSVRGLAFRSGGIVALSPLRSLIPDLDSLPPPLRPELRSLSDGAPVASLLASRGCSWSCSFCSIRSFYGSCEGPARRSRSPLRVVDEMESLHGERGVEVFVFQDDDFAARTSEREAWLNGFLSELDRRGLGRALRWKISCRVDDLSDERLDAMMERGLRAVYLGVESGNERGLRLMNKRVDVEDNRRAIELIERKGLLLGMGFMLFDPSSDERSLRDNIAFLDGVGREGYLALNFCKMLPYAGTPIEESLAAEGRLSGTAVRPDYRLASPAMDFYEHLVHRVFRRRNFAPEGLAAKLQDLDFDFRMRSPGASPGSISRLREITARANRTMTETLLALLDWVAENEDHAGRAAPSKGESVFLADLAAREWRAELECEAEAEALVAAVAGPT
jgi:Fe-S oxidoreductase